IPDIIESGELDAMGDHDTDFIPNYMDPNFCTLNSKGVCISLDKDGDGVINAFDLDSDNDGILDAIEANGGTVPANFSTTTGRFTNTANNQGVAYTFSTKLDTDNDGLPDYLDIDSDNDGILDNLEAQVTDERKLRTGLDSDKD